jgi:hypothetical protein
MNTSDIQVTISPDKYLGELQTSITNEVADLRSILRRLEDSSYLEKALTPRHDALMQLGIKPSIATADTNAVTQAAGSACNRCFHNLVRSLLTFIDRLIAIRRFVAEGMELPPGNQTVADVQFLINERLDEMYQVVAHDRSLSNTRKIGEFALPAGLASKSLLSFVTLRNCLEHHGGIPSQEIKVTALKLVLSHGGEEITQLPHEVEGGATVSLIADEHEWEFPAKVAVVLTEDQIEAVYMTIIYSIARALIHAINTIPNTTSK